jgi:hypothetical protein
LTEIARRYVATGLALSRALGLPWTEDFLRQHRESISCCFIEAGRAGVRLPERVHLPPLEPAGHPAPVPGPDRDTLPPGEGEAPVVMTNDQAPLTAASLPTHIPAGLPCAGQAIATVKPAQLRMLLSKVDQLGAAQGSQWLPLLEALASERAARLQAGQRPKLVAVEGDGHGV